MEYDTDGTTILSTKPLEGGLLYDPGVDFVVRAKYSDANGVIHMQAVYKKEDSSYKRPEVANLTLDANDENGMGGYL